MLDTFKKNKVNVINIDNVPNVNPMVRAFDEKHLATNKLSLLYFIFLLFKTKFILRKF